MRLYLRESERRPAPEPVRTDDRLPVAVGTAAWVVALAIMIAMSGTLIESGRGWWLGAGVAGVVLGALGLLVTIRRRSRG